MADIKITALPTWNGVAGSKAYAVLATEAPDSSNYKIDFTYFSGIVKVNNAATQPIISFDNRANGASGYGVQFNYSQGVVTAYVTGIQTSSVSVKGEVVANPNFVASGTEIGATVGIDYIINGSNIQLYTPWADFTAAIADANAGFWVNSPVVTDTTVNGTGEAVLDSGIYQWDSASDYILMSARNNVAGGVSYQARINVSSGQLQVRSLPFGGAWTGWTGSSGGSGGGGGTSITVGGVVQASLNLGSASTFADLPVNFSVDDGDLVAGVSRVLIDSIAETAIADNIFKKISQLQWLSGLSQVVAEVVFTYSSFTGRVNVEITAAGGASFTEADVTLMNARTLYVLDATGDVECTLSGGVFALTSPLGSISTEAQGGVSFAVAGLTQYIYDSRTELGTVTTSNGPPNWQVVFSAVQNSRFVSSTSVTTQFNVDFLGALRQAIAPNLVTFTRNTDSTSIGDTGGGTRLSLTDYTQGGSFAFLTYDSANHRLINNTANPVIIDVDCQFPFKAANPITEVDFWIQRNSPTAVSTGRLAQTAIAGGVSGSNGITGGILNLNINRLTLAPNDYINFFAWSDSTTGASIVIQASVFGDSGNSNWLRIVEYRQ